MEKIREPCASAFPKIVARAFQQKDGSRLSVVLLLQVFDIPYLPACIVKMHLRLIIGDNVPQEIILSCSLSCQKSFTHGKTVCFLNFRQEERNPPCRHFDNTMFHNEQQFPILSGGGLLQSSHESQEYSSSHWCLYAIGVYGSHFALTIEKIFVLIVDLGH